MSRHDEDRLGDIRSACEVIRSYLRCGELADGLVFDAVRMRLVEIGEAVKSLSPELLATEPEIPWREVAAMRDHLAHRYFDTVHAIVAATVATDLAELELAVQRLSAHAEGR